MSFWRRFIPFALALLGGLSVNSRAASVDSRGVQFFSFTSFGQFTLAPGTNANTSVLTSPVLSTHIPWDELIVSWNARMPSGTSFTIEARAIYPEHTTKWFNLGFWSADREKNPSKSLKEQRDADGNTDTDTLVLKQSADKVQVRITQIGEAREKPKLKFLSLSLLDSQGTPEELPPNRAAWGKLVDVPERSQMAYTNGDVLCSPTTVSMLLAHWSYQLGRPGLNCDVPEVVNGVFDPVWGGTGNWAFNTAYVGSFRGMRAYTTRLSDVSELEDFIARGIPVGLSLCYNRLRGKGHEPSGHLVVCVGFTKNGDPIINDPGTSKNVRKTFPRANLIDAWAYSKNTVYIVYPANTQLPHDRFGHWESPTSKALARQRK